MDKKKICILTISMNPGGAERVISLLLKHLVLDYDVTLVLLSDDIKFDIPKEVKLHILGPSNILKNKPPHDKLKNTVKFIYKYRKIIKKEHFDVAMSFLALPNIINSIIANYASKANTKTIISERCYPSKMYANSGFAMRMAKIFYPIFYNRNDKLFSNSIHINEDLKSNFKIRIPMSVIYNPIEIEKSKPFVDHYKEGNVFKLINVGSHSHPKHQILILQALTHLNDDYHLTILGKGNLTPDLKRFSTEYNIEHKVNLAGRVLNVNDYLLESDCFVLSSRTEGFPNVLLEAMAIGLPVISTNCMSGPLEILNDNEPITIAKGEFYLAKYGIMINVDDDKALAKAIEFYKTNPGKRREYSDLGFRKAQTFALPEIYKEVKQLINS